MLLHFVTLCFTNVVCYLLIVNEKQCNDSYCFNSGLLHPDHHLCSTQSRSLALRPIKLIHIRPPRVQRPAVLRLAALLFRLNDHCLLWTETLVQGRLEIHGVVPWLVRQEGSYTVSRLHPHLWGYHLEAMGQSRGSVRKPIVGVCSLVYIFVGVGGCLISVRFYLTNSI